MVIFLAVPSIAFFTPSIDAIVVAVAVAFVVVSFGRSVGGGEDGSMCLESCLLDDDNGGCFANSGDNGVVLLAAAVVLVVVELPSLLLSVMVTEEQASSTGELRSLCLLLESCFCTPFCTPSTVAFAMSEVFVMTVLVRTTGVARIYRGTIFYMVSEVCG